jgi:hypothetical protein
MIQPLAPTPTTSTQVNELCGLPIPAVRIAIIGVLVVASITGATAQDHWSKDRCERYITSVWDMALAGGWGKDACHALQQEVGYACPSYTKRCVPPVDNYKPGYRREMNRLIENPK